MQHLAIVMDGNRRWARKQGLATAYGHKAGVDSVKRAIEFCLEKQIKFLSLYTFSIENFKRSPKEVAYLFNLLVTSARNECDDLIAKGVRVCFIGERSLFPAHVLPTCEEVEQKTVAGQALQINVMFCYGGRQEIFSGIKRLVRRVIAGDLAVDTLTPKDFEQCLWMHGVPEPDLIVRTGGVKRLSNFLLYHAAYSELYFLDCYWPEVTKEHLEDAVQAFTQRQRNFGI